MDVKHTYQKISGYFSMGITASIVLLYSFSGCKEIFQSDWRQEYMKQEKKKIITYTRQFEYDSGNYKLESIDSSFDSFNEKGQLLSKNDLLFYQYDPTGKLICEQYCMRSCDYFQKEVFTYDSLNRLIKSVVIVSPEKQYISNQYFYNLKNLVIKQIRGSDSNATSFEYTYDSLSRKIKETKREYNSNTKKWLSSVDSFFYGEGKNILIKKRYHSEKDLLTISKFAYIDTLLISQIDTTITSNSTYLPNSKAIYSAYYNKTEYKYDLHNRTIEMLRYRPDYFTPVDKTTYEYRDLTKP